MLRPICLVTWAVALGFGCAEGSSIEGDASSGRGGSGGAGGDAATTSTSTGAAGGGAGGSGGGGGSGGLVAQSCPPDQIATGVTDGQLVCASIDQAARDAIHDGCSVVFGWRDGCGVCADPPTKWGSVGAAACSNLGIHGTCTGPSLAGQTVQLYGLNMDGDVNDDDKFYLGFQCDPGSAEAEAGPCDPGELVSGLSGQTVTCTPASGAVLDYVRQSCSLFFGWRDSCDGCTTAPSKWGRVSPTDCNTGVGAGNTCTTPMLGGEATQLFGLSVGGDVDGNDKLYVGMRCDPPTPATTTATGDCPPGQFVTGVDADGALTCASPAPIVSGYFKDHCALYFGWNDGCDGCTTAPGKWGYVRDEFCANGLGVDSTCQSVVLAADTVNLFGLNTDGDVNDDDKLYFGFRCD